jgi:putative membrane protein
LRFSPSSIFSRSWICLSSLLDERSRHARARLDNLSECAGTLAGCNVGGSRSKKKENTMPQLRNVPALLATAAFLAIAGCSSPQGLSDMSGAAASLSATDRTFISQAAYGSLSEVALGQLAMQQASNTEVRAFGQQMVNEHTRMNEDLIAIATSKGVTPPSAPDPGRQAVSAQLAQLEGAEFDRQYTTQQLADHEATLTLLQGEASSGQDPELRSFAERYVPVVEDHVAMLRRLQAQVVASRGSSR